MSFDENIVAYSWVRCLFFQVHFFFQMAASAGRSVARSSIHAACCTAVASARAFGVLSLVPPTFLQFAELRPGQQCSAKSVYHLAEVQYIGLYYSSARQPYAYFSRDSGNFPLIICLSSIRYPQPQITQKQTRFTFGAVDADFGPDNAHALATDGS